MFNVITKEFVYVVDNEEEKNWYDDVVAVVKTTSENLPIDSAVEYIHRELEGANYHSEMTFFDKVWSCVEKFVDEDEQKKILFDLLNQSLV